MRKILLILGILLLIGCIQNNTFEDRTKELEIIKEVESKQYSFGKVSLHVQSFLIVDDLVNDNLKYKINIDCRDLQETIDYKYIQKNQNDTFIIDFINPIIKLCKGIFPFLFIERPRFTNWIKDTEEEYSSRTGDCDDLLCLGEGYYG